MIMFGLCIVLNSPRFVSCLVGMLYLNNDSVLHSFAENTTGNSSLMHNAIPGPPISDNTSSFIIGKELFPNPTINQIGQSRPQKTRPQICSEDIMFRNFNDCKSLCNGTVSSGKFNSLQVKRSFKLIILLKHEYSITENVSLLTELSGNLIFPNSHFTLGKDGKVYLCMPMPNKFVHCPKWKIDPVEVDRIRKGRRIWVSTQKRYYEVTEYIYWKKIKKYSICKHPETPNTEKLRKLHLIGWFISSIFLGMLIVFSIIFSKLNLNRSKLLLCNFGMFFIAYVCLCIRYFELALPTFWCKLIAHLIQFTFLSAFCWTNVQAINIFLHFSKLNVRRNNKTLDKKYFIIYAIHGWGTPLGIAIATLTVEELNAKSLNPKFAKECWFRKQDTTEAFLYFYGPLSIILIINFFMFIITVYNLYKTGKGISFVKKNIQKQLFKVYLKLIVVMGLCWIMEVLSVAIGGDPEIWIFTDMINALQGLFIFIVYVCKPSFLKKCFNKCCRHPGCPSWWPLKPITDSSTYRVGETTASTTNNSTLGRDISLVSTGDKL